jgi:translation initiation factor 2 subunit 3
MAKGKNIDIGKIPTMNVGIFGHIDHGKTTLLQKLTGKWADTHSEELKRGITIKLGYADTIVYKDKEYNIEGNGNADRYVSFIDAPGHEMLMAIMLSGAAIIDAAVLVVSAQEGIKPQTREHLVALHSRKIKNVIVVQNKIDLVSREEAEKNYQDIKKFLKGTSAENAEIIPVSAQQGINIGEVLRAICSVEIPERDTESEPVFLVARSFDINKPGTKVQDIHGGVLGGTLKKGKLKLGDEIEIKPGRNIKKENQLFYETVNTKITRIRKGNYEISEAFPGGSLALETELDPILTKADSLSGCVAGRKIPDSKTNIRVRFSLFDEIVGEEGHKNVDEIKSTELLMLSVNTSTSVGTVRKIKDEEIELDLKIPVVPLKGETVGIARNIHGHWRLIGFGELID